MNLEALIHKLEQRIVDLRAESQRVGQQAADQAMAPYLAAIGEDQRLLNDLQGWLSAGNGRQQAESLTEQTPEVAHGQSPS